LAVLVAIQFREDFLQAIQFVAANAAVMIAIEEFKESRHWATSLSVNRTASIGRATSGIATRTTSISFGRASPFWRTSVTFATRFWFAITFGLASIRTIGTGSASFTVRLASVSLWLTSRVTTTTFRRTSFPLGASFTFASLSERNHVIERQDVFLRTLKHLSSTVAKLFRDFVERDFAVTVHVHPLELLFGIRPPGWISHAGAARRRTNFRHRAAELFLSQLRLAELLEHSAQSLAQTFRQFVLLQLAVVVFVEPLEELARSEAVPCTGESLPNLLEVFGRERIFVLSCHHLAEKPRGAVFRDLVFGQLAVFVLVEPFQHLLEVDHRPPAAGAALTATSSATLHRSVTALNRCVELGLRQFAVVVLVAKAHQPVEEPALLFWDFVRHQLAVAVLVELLEQFFRLIGFRFFRIVLRKRDDGQPDQPAGEQRPEIDPLHNVVPDERLIGFGPTRREHTAWNPQFHAWFRENSPFVVTRFIGSGV
jgi:hypothetical protein